MLDEILTRPEVAQLLKVADKTVHTMAQQGELPAFKVRGQWRIKRADPDAWLERQKAAARAEPAPQRPPQRRRGQAIVNQEHARLASVERRGEVAQ